ncbi:MAG TPA: secretin N-terminal domain-containing protein [Halioglobus sp.]
MRLIVIFFLCFSATVALAQQHLTTIAIHYANPEQLVTVIRPYLTEGSSVSVYQNQLILNVTPEELVKTRELLKQLDSAGRQLLVSVRSEGLGNESNRSVDVDTVIKSGDVAVTTGQGRVTRESRTTVRVDDYRGTSTDNGNQSVRATEGVAAYVSTGMTAPIQRYATSPDGRRYYQQDYIDAVTGFYATTRVNDGVARITIEQSNNQLKGRAIATQQLQSEVTGALGQWLPIGVISGAEIHQDQGIGSRGSSSRTNSTQLFIKVELLE